MPLTLRNSFDFREKKNQEITTYISVRAQNLLREASVDLFRQLLITIWSLDIMQTARCKAENCMCVSNTCVRNTDD